MDFHTVTGNEMQRDHDRIRQVRSEAFSVVELLLRRLQLDSARERHLIKLAHGEISQHHKRDHNLDNLFRGKPLLAPSKHLVRCNARKALPEHNKDNKFEV